jgi:hypothetical protein
MKGIRIGEECGEEGIRKETTEERKGKRKLSGS